MLIGGETNFQGGSLGSVGHLIVRIHMIMRYLYDRFVLYCIVCMEGGD